MHTEIMQQKVLIIKRYTLSELRNSTCNCSDRWHKIHQAIMAFWQWPKSASRWRAFPSFPDGSNFK